MIIGLGRTASQATLQLMAVQGRYDVLASLTNEDGDEQIAVSVEAADDNYYFPLDRSALACFEVTLPDDGLRSDLVLLKKHCRFVSDVVKSESFCGLGPEGQLDQLGGMMGHLNEELARRIDSDSFLVECRRYRDVLGGKDFPDDGSEDSLLLSIHGDRLKYVLPEGTDAPVLELMDDEARSKYHIRMDDVVDIIPLDSEVEVQSMDLFAKWFDDDYRQVACDLENHLAYMKVGALDEAEWQEEYREAVDQLEQAMPSWDELVPIHITGYVYVPLDEGGYGLEFCDSNDVIVDDVELIETDEGYRAVLAATVLNRHTDDEERVYICPSRYRLLRFEAQVMKGQPGDLVDCLHDEAAASKAAVSQPGFFELAREEQLAILEQYENNVGDHLGTLAEFFGEYDVDFHVTEYRCLPGDILDLGWDSDLVGYEVAKDEGGLSITADSFTAHNPDVDRLKGDASFRSFADFSLSEGQPMVILGSSVTGMFYLVKVSDIVVCSPIFSTGEQ